MSETYPIVLAITGGSGAIYALRLLEVLLAAGQKVQLSISEAGRQVLRHELGLNLDLDDFRLDDLFPDTERLADPRCATLRAIYPDFDRRCDVSAEAITYYHYKNLLAPIASGSNRTAGMVICPSSGGTLSAIAHGAAGNLIQRAAEVHLKERRPVIVVPRETPLSATHIENMRRATEAGAIVLPASPGWYHGVTTLRDLVDFMVGRICDQLGIDNCLMKRWGE